MAGVLQHLRSSTLNKRPNPASMVDGQVAINYASGSPGMFFKDSNGSLVKVGPVHVGSTAPNVSPASGGTAGNSLGEQWLDTSGGTYVFKIWDGGSWRSEAGEFVNSAGDTMTGSLTMGPAATLIFEGSTDDGFETTLTVVNPTVDRTITLPNVTGTVITTGDTGTVTSTMLLDGTILDADVNASAAIAGTKISPNFGSQTITTTGIVSAALGAAATPSITFTGDTNTGIYSPGADQVAISTAGTGRLFVDASGNVGINAVSPATRLDVAGNVTTSQNFFTGANSGVWFNGANNFAVGVASASSALVAYTSNTERLRITSAGLVGVGTSSPNFRIHSGIDLGTQSPSIRQIGAVIGASYTRSDNAQFVGRRVALGAIDYAAAIQGEDNGGTAVNLVINPSGGNVGIGTTSAAATLHVVSADNATTGLISGATNAIRFVGNNTGIGGGAIEGVNAAASAFAPLLVGGSDLRFAISGTERARIDSSGRLLVGTSTASQWNHFSPDLPLQVARANSLNAAIQLTAFRANDEYGPNVIVGKSRSNTLGTNTAILDGDFLGELTFVGANGTSWSQGAGISARADGQTWANGDCPTRLVFSTTADGASSPTERMRISNNGYSKHANAGSGAYDNTTGAYHELVSDGADNAVRIKNTNATPFGLRITHTTDSNAAGNEFLACFGAATIRAAIRSNGGLANYSANDANLSDRNAKKDISPAADTWDCIKEWEIVNYRYKDQPDDADLNLGVIAQQVAESCPEVITVFQEATDDQPEKLGVKEQQMYWMAIKALQEAQVRIEQLEAKVAALETP